MKPAEPSAELDEVWDTTTGKARGLLRRPSPAGKFRHVRRSPSPELAPWIEHYWMVSWDLRGQPAYTAETLPHPNFQLILENGTATLCGVCTGKFTRSLEGQSQVFGIKFTPGGFRPFLNAPASTLLNRGIPASRIFGDAVSSLLDGSNEDERIASANAFFLARRPTPDENAALAGQLVRLIFDEPTLKTVDDLTRRAGMAKRSLQRVFSEYVGVNPKWVIRRYRLHELVERLNSGEQLDWPQVALDLGYFDQAHLINDFRSIVGYSPTQYQCRLATTV